MKHGFTKDELDSTLVSFSEMLWFYKQHSTYPGTQWRPGSPYIAITGLLSQTPRVVTGEILSVDGAARV